METSLQGENNDVHEQGFSVIHGYMNKKTAAVCILLDFLTSL